MKLSAIASEVQEGDFLPDLDNGYVVDVDEEASAEVCWSRHGGAFPEGMVLITFHDSEGEENYLILTSDHPITIERR